MWRHKKEGAEAARERDTYEGLPVDRRFAQERSHSIPETRKHPDGYVRQGAFYGADENTRQSSYARPGIYYGREGGPGRASMEPENMRRSDPRVERPYRRGTDLNAAQRRGAGLNGAQRRGADPYAGGRRGTAPYAAGRRGTGQGAMQPGGGFDARGDMVKKRRRRHPLRNFFLVLFILLLATGGAGLLILGRMDHTRLGSLIRNAGFSTGSSYTNIVLYGVDSRTGALTTECHSDTIMICSLNRTTKEIRIASVYRDTYLDNTNGEYRKATECYYFGGPERSINMLNKNLDLDISDYITVNFNAVVKAVDLLGGIDLEVTDEEVQYINGYCVENEQVTGASYTPLTSSGYVHLTGTQALAYCRIRFTEGWDFKRTERQRTVLNLIYQKAVQKGPIAMASIITTMLPSVSTSMGSVEILALAADIGSYTLADQCGFPFDKTSADLAAGDCVVPVNLAGNVRQLHAFLFGDYDYTPSETVQAISDQISNDTGVWG